MFSLKRALKYLFNNPLRFVDSSIKYLSFLFPDKMYLSIRYRCLMGQRIDWSNPKTFTEKIQWLKIFGYKPEFTELVDKLAAKKYAEDRIGAGHIIPTLAVWDSVKDIDWAILPEQFVLKTTHGGGSTGVVVCKDKNTFDLKAASEKLNKSMSTVVGKEYREKPYYAVPRKIIAEEYKSNEDINGNTIDGDLDDYKFYCFNGEPRYCQVIRGRSTKETIDFYDMQWNKMPFIGLNPNASRGEVDVRKPICLDTAIDICRALSKDLPFARVDLYLVGRKIYFGEITLYPGGGIGSFRPEEWNLKLGELIDINVCSR